MRRFNNDDRGAAAVLIAGCLISLIAFGGLVLDGGNAYSQRRQMQNAADSSALAGANALQNHRQGLVGSSAIYTAARDAAARNDAKSATFECYLVQLNDAGAELGSTDCPEFDNEAVPPGSFKVRVRVDSDHNTQFMSVVGIDTFNASGNAAASLQAATIAYGPFMVCGTAVTASGEAIPLLVPDVDDPTGWAWNPEAINEIYDIWGNDIKQSGRDCGDAERRGQDSFRGLVDMSEAHQVPGWWPADTGNQAGTEVPLPLIGGCTIDDVNNKLHGGSPGEDCELALAVCAVSNGEAGTNVELYCVKVGRFLITTNVSTGQPGIEGVFLGGGVANSGAGNGVPGPDDVVVIKLNE